jgi:hypothetical protein
MRVHSKGYASLQTRTSPTPPSSTSTCSLDTHALFQGIEICNGDRTNARSYIASACLTVANIFHIATLWRIPGRQSMTQWGWEIVEDCGCCENQGIVLPVSLCLPSAQVENGPRTNGLNRASKCIGVVGPVCNKILNGRLVQ